MSDVVKPMLEDVGTRYKFLTELQDAWAAAVEIRKQLYERFPTEKDRQRVEELEAAVRTLQAYIDILSDRKNKEYGLRREVDAIPKIKGGEHEKEVQTSDPESNPKFDQDHPST